MIADSYSGNLQGPSQNQNHSSENNSSEQQSALLSAQNQRHTLIDVPVTDLVGIYDIPDEKLRAGEKWKKQEKDKERTEEEIEETKQLQANLYKKGSKLLTLLFFNLSYPFVGNIRFLSTCFHHVR